MALINCAECSKEISDKAEACPHCGCPVERSPKKEPLLAMIWEEEKDGYISIQCPSCSKSSVIKEALVSKTATGYKVNGEGRCACGLVFNEICRDKRIKCPNCGSTEISIQKEGFNAGSACCGAILAGPLGILCGAKGANKLNRHCLNCGHKWLVGQ
jgi:DNA-directed RNA polymerase subunit RPC12/RpoP